MVEFTENKVFVLLLCVFMAAQFLQVAVRIDFLAAIRFEFVLGALLSIIAVFSLIVHKDEGTILRKYIILYYIVLIIQIPFSFDYDSSVNFFIDRVFKFSMLALFIVAFIRSPKAFNFFIAFYMLVCFRLLFEGVNGWISGSLVWQNQGIMRLHGSIPILEHPNSFAAFAVSMIPFIYFLFFQVRKLFKAFLLVMFVFALIVVLYTGSRSGYVAFLGFFLVLLLKSQGKMKIFFALLFSGILLVSFLPKQYYERFESIFTQKEKEGHSSDARIQIIKDAIDISIKHPFGVGIHAFPKIRAFYFGRVQDTHSLYLEILTNLGIQGLIVWLLMIATLFKILKSGRIMLYEVLDKIKQDENREICEDEKNISFMIAASKAVSFYLIVHLFLGLFGMDLYEVYWWFAIGLALVIHRMAKIYLSNYGLTDAGEISRY